MGSMRDTLVGPPYVTLPLGDHSNSFKKISVSLGLHWLVFSYNVSTLATYWISIDHFPQHMGWLKKPISESQLALIPKYSVLSSIAFFQVIFFVSNQSNVIDRLKVLLKYARPSDSSTSTKNWEKRLNITCLCLSAIWKAVVSTTSYLALIYSALTRNTTLQKNQLDLPMGLGLAVIFFLPNFLAQYSTFIEFLNHPPHLTSCGRANTIAWYGSIGYTSCDVALYFNTFDKVFKNWTPEGHHLSSYDTLLEKVLLICGSILSLFFFLETQRVYYHRIFKIFNPSPMARDPRFSPIITKLGLLSAFWKFSVSSLAVFFITKMIIPEEASWFLLGALSIGNMICQLSLYLGSSNVVWPCTSSCFANSENQILRFPENQIDINPTENNLSEFQNNNFMLP